MAAAVAGCAATPPDLASGATTASVPASAAAAVQTPAPARKAQTVKVGLLLPLSGGGQAGLVAETMRKAAELAVTDLNAPHLALLVRDDKATPEGAEAAARELTTAGAEIILGPLFARSVQAASPIARAANVPIVAFSNDRHVAGAGVSLLSFLAEPEVGRVISYAAAQGKKRLVALVPDDAYGKIVEIALRQAAARDGARLLAIETYPAQANGMLDAVTKLRDALRGIEEHGDPVDALFIAGGEEALGALSPQIKQAGIVTPRLKVLGTGALDYANAGRDPILLGAWFAAPDPKGWKDFADKYARAYGHAPPRIASLAYDAIGMAAALSQGPDGARYIPSQVLRPSGFTGVDGHFRLTSDGLADRALAVLEVQAFGARVIDLPPPPTPEKVARLN
jgi:branched-chain amino acid transport system substrate-binding protein